jgi:hypothetical protein
MQETAWRRPSVVIYETISNYMNRVDDTDANKQEESKSISTTPKSIFIVKHLVTSVDCFIWRLKTVKFIGNVLKVKDGDCGIQKLLKDF